MRKFILATCFFLFAATACAQFVGGGDPRDSIIIESKTVARGLTGSPAFSVRVFITNKDSLSYMVLMCSTRTISGGGYALLNRTATGQLAFASIVQPLGLFGQFYTAKNTLHYDDTNPDAFLVAGGSDGTLETAEPPSAVRKPVWELKFRASSSLPGEMGIYEAPYLFGETYSYFTTLRPIRDIGVNFLPGVLTITERQRGDLNGDIALSAADIVWGIKAAFGASPPAGRGACDLNCDGEVSLADVMLLLNAAFLQEPFPC